MGSARGMRRGIPDATTSLVAFPSPFLLATEPQSLPSTLGVTRLLLFGRVLVPPCAFFDPQKGRGRGRAHREGGICGATVPWGGQNPSPADLPASSLRLAIPWGRPVSGQGLGIREHCWAGPSGPHTCMVPKKETGGPGRSSASQVGRPNSPVLRGVASVAAMF